MNYALKQNEDENDDKIGAMDDFNETDHHQI